MTLFFVFKLNICTSKASFLNLTQPVRYLTNIIMVLFNDLFIYIVVVVFSFFGTSKELIGDSQKALNL